MKQGADTNQKWIENEQLPIKALPELILMKVSLGMEKREQSFFDFIFFFLRHSKVDLQNLAYIFYKSFSSANVKSAVFGNV